MNESSAKLLKPGDVVLVVCRLPLANSRPCCKKCSGVSVGQIRRNYTSGCCELTGLNVKCFNEKTAKNTFTWKSICMILDG